MLWASFGLISVFPASFSQTNGGQALCLSNSLMRQTAIFLHDIIINLPRRATRGQKKSFLLSWVHDRYDAGNPLNA